MHFWDIEKGNTVSYLKNGLILDKSKQRRPFYNEGDDREYSPYKIKIYKLEYDVEIIPFLLKEMADFGIFFAKVRYLPYNAKKDAKIGHFFKQKRDNFNVVFKKYFLQGSGDGCQYTSLRR